MTEKTLPPAVALYFHSLSGIGGGAERMIVALAEALAYRGWHPHLMSWDEPGAQSFYPIPKDVAWHKLGAAPGYTGKVKRVVTLSGRLRAVQARVMVGFVMSGDRTVMTAAKMTRTKLIAAERNGPSIYWLRYGTLQRAAAFATLGFADAITVQFPRFADRYPASLRHLIHAIPNSVPEASRRAEPDRPDQRGRFRLIWVGRLDSIQKRPTLMLDAFARVAAQHPDWDLRFIGDGPEAPALGARIAAVGLAGRVQITPTVRNIGEAYATAHLFVTTSSWEGFPNALAEAMATGLPAVGFSEAEGVADLIGSSAGWLVPHCHDAAALAEVLHIALASHEIRAKRGESARAAMQQYGAEPIFDRWSNLLSSVGGLVL